MSMSQQAPEHPFLTAVRLAAQVGAPHFYADPSFKEPVVVLPMRQYQALLSGQTGEKLEAPVVGGVAPASAQEAVVRVGVLGEDDPEVLFDHQALEREIRQAEYKTSKNTRNIGPWQPVVERPVGSEGGEEGFYMHPVPRKQGF